MANALAGEPLRNHLLARLPADDYARLLPHLAPVALELNQSIYEVGGAIDYAYFPTRGVISAVATTEDGNAIEIATIGNEGMAGLPCAHRAGMFADPTFRPGGGRGLAHFGRNTPPRNAARRPRAQNSASLPSAFMVQLSQSVACNGLHTIQQRCCRWLLITHDRVQNDVLPLTHELLAIMLGVRRPGITVVLQSLQVRGYVEYSRGKIEVRDRQGLESASCECYRVVKMHHERLLGPDAIG